MSGRSGYVRVEQAARSQLDYQKLAQASKSQVIHNIPESALSGFPYPSQIIQEDNFLHRQDPAIPSHDQYFLPRIGHAVRQTPILSTALPSQVHRSQFRVKMDEKSVKFRNEIRRAFRMKKNKSALANSGALQAEKIYQGKDLQFIEIFNPRDNHICSYFCHQNYHYEPQFFQSLSSPAPLSRWLGKGRLVEPWAKLRKDPELFDSFGDTLIYFGDAQKKFPHSNPSLRINSHFIEETDSIVLINMLRENSAVDYVRPLQQKYGSSSSLASFQNCYLDGQISYEIFFPAPHHLSMTDAQHHQVTTRNFFALLLNASLVGQSMYRALYDLRHRVDEYMPADTDSAGMIIDWITSRGIDDPRRNLSTAFSLLAWSEGDCVRWENGWKEAFCHAVGMRALDPDQKVELIPEFHYLSPITKTLLSRSSMDTRLRIRESEFRLDNFDFTDMWDVTDQKVSSGRSAFDRFRKFLVQHYQKIYSTWPPVTSSGGQWLTRTVAKRLSQDFGALYDYLVNRSISWDCECERNGPVWKMKCATNKTFDPDTVQIPITDILISFDDRMEYPHIPHPYCLTPEPIMARSNSKIKKNIEKKTRKQEELKQERQAAISYQDSTNIYILGADFVSNDLVDAFTNFEKGERLVDADLYNGRRGRWILIYGVLQVLASISVDTPQLRFVDNVDYHLHCSLRGTPPWRGANQNQPEADHTSSYCWLAPDRWRSLQPISIDSRSDSPSYTCTTRSKPDTQSNRESSYRLSSSSQVSSDFDLSIGSTTFTNLNFSPILESHKSRSSCCEVSEKGKVIPCTLQGDQLAELTGRSIDSAISNVGNVFMPPLSLRSSHLRSVDESGVFSPRMAYQKDQRKIQEGHLEPKLSCCAHIGHRRSPREHR
ncbi:hypothetical protein GcM3_183048 [Golovinomyces cichoracearum]|uniref:DUF8004 domain-containing protein n=1 Tax=Golovinomyces cichoracearum TaxID=62708 RepID=A0A420HLJ8_9PEZI|nr:hypothetical protein GcM3_183048 [Golovinomyces cichoracearum]